LDSEENPESKDDNKFERQDSNKKGENELLGVTLKITSVILQSINWVVARFIYINNPDLVGS